MLALSIKQPWAWLIANGIKDVENRTWKTDFRGKILIHSGKNHSLNGMQLSRYQVNCIYRKCMEKALELPEDEDLKLGGFIGIVEIIDCIKNHPSIWAEPDKWHWVLKNPEVIAFKKYKGKLKLFQVPEFDF